MKRSRISRERLVKTRDHIVLLKCSTVTCNAPHVMSLSDEEHKHVEPILTANHASASDNEAELPFNVAVSCDDLSAAIRNSYVIRTTFHKSEETFATVTWLEETQFMIPWMTLLQALFDDALTVFQKLAKACSFCFTETDERAQKFDKLFAIDRLFSVLKLEDTFGILTAFADFDPATIKIDFDASNFAEVDLLRSLTHRLGRNIFKGKIPCPPTIVAQVRKSIQATHYLWAPDANNTTVSWFVHARDWMDVFDDVKIDERFTMFRQHILKVYIRANNLLEAHDAWDVLRTWLYPEAIVCNIPSQNGSKDIPISKFVCRPGIRHSLLFVFWKRADGINWTSATGRESDLYYERGSRYYHSTTTKPNMGLNWLYGIDSIKFSARRVVVYRARDVRKTVERFIAEKAVEMPLKHCMQFHLEHVKTHAEAWMLLYRAFWYDAMSVKDDGTKMWVLPGGARKLYTVGNQKFTENLWPWNLKAKPVEKKEG